MDTRTQGAVARDALHDVDRLDEKAGAENAVDDHAERKLVWKIDLLLMPLLTFSFGIQFVRASSTTSQPLTKEQDYSTTNSSSARQRCLAC